MEEERRLSKAVVTRARLAAAAVETFAKRGFHGTTTRDIAKAAGLSTGALYVHYESKEQLLFEISLRGHHETLSVITAAKAKAEAADLMEQLRQVVYSYVTYHVREHTVARVVNYELAALSPAHLQVVQTIRHRIDTEMRELVTHGCQAGVFHTRRPRFAAAAILSLGVDIGRWYDEKQTWTADQIGRAYTDIALAIVGARAAGPRADPV